MDDRPHRHVRIDDILIFDAEAGTQPTTETSRPPVHDAQTRGESQQIPMRLQKRMRLDRRWRSATQPRPIPAIRNAGYKNAAHAPSLWGTSTHGGGYDRGSNLATSA